MTIPRILPLSIAALLAILPPSAAYEGLENDFATCTKSKEKKAVVAACTRLIDNANKDAKGDILNYFYIFRALNSDNPKVICSDAREILRRGSEDQQFITTATNLQKKHCKN